MGDPTLGGFELAVGSICSLLRYCSANASIATKTASARRASSVETCVSDCFRMRAHFFRHNLTETEAILWRRISGKQLGVAFRRQVPVGGKYIADFIAPGIRLIVEVDDRTHELKRMADALRDRNLSRLGYRVLRLPAEVVRGNVEEAVARIVAALFVAT